MVLKPSWEVLGAVDGPQPTKWKIGGGHKSILGPSWAPKRAPKRPQDDTLRAQDAPRGRQDGAQDDQKSIIKSSLKTIAF